MMQEVKLHRSPPAGGLAWGMTVDKVPAHRTPRPTFPADVLAQPADHGARRAAADRLRLAAEGAFAEVQGGGDRALHAALNVFAVETEALRARVEMQVEVLKLIRGYASDPWLRSLAEAALATEGGDLSAWLPLFLHDPDIAREARDTGHNEGRPA